MHKAAAFDVWLLPCWPEASDGGDNNVSDTSSPPAPPEVRLFFTLFFWNHRWTDVLQTNSRLFFLFWDFGRTKWWKNKKTKQKNQQKIVFVTVLKDFIGQLRRESPSRSARCFCVTYCHFLLLPVLSSDSWKRRQLQMWHFAWFPPKQRPPAASVNSRWLQHSHRSTKWRQNKIGTNKLIRSQSYGRC